MRYLLLIIITFLLISCGARVSYDYYPIISSNLSELDNIRIMKATDSILQMRGFIKSKSPQFLINFFVKEFISQSNSSIGIGVGTGGSNGSVGVSGGIPVGGNMINQALTFDFIDAKDDKLIWQSVGSDELSVNANSSKIIIIILI